uniref:Origin recognition complex subunit 4 n=1 Tax=Strigamia maritima TaxID=126957 RepID=T1ISQ6_STRMM
MIMKTNRANKTMKAKLKCVNIKKLIREQLQLSCVQFTTPQTDKELEAIGNLETLIKRTTLFGESNSVLVIGPSGSGKNHLLRIVLQKLNNDVDVSSSLLQIHLNGLLQTDDRIALKEITRQLHLENLSETKTFRSFAENLQFLLNSLKDGDRSKSILFVLDEFDLFCHHKNQTLLYNLFDISQSAQTPIVIVGLTCRMDVIELLEKRVKSRFSHRQIYVFPTHLFDEYMNLAITLLTIPSTSKETEEWNRSVEDTFEKPTVSDVIKQYFNNNKTVLALKKFLLTAVNCIKEDETCLSVAVVVDAFHLLTVNSKSAVLTGLSILEMSLVIAMMQLAKKYENEAFNLCMVYDEYMKFVRSRGTVQTYEFPIICKAFEHLQSLELVKPVLNSSGKGAINYQLMTLLVEKSQVAEGFQTYSGLSTEIKEWAKSALLGHWARKRFSEFHRGSYIPKTLIENGHFQIPFSATNQQGKKKCILETVTPHRWPSLMQLDPVGQVASPPPTDPMNKNLNEMMESFLDLDQFLSGDKIMTQDSFREFISPVNGDINNTASCNETYTHNLSSEVKFNDAWDILNAMESDSHASFESIFNCVSTKEKPIQDNMDNLTSINTPGLDVSTLLSNMPLLPFDVSTPDVDTTILTSDIPEFFSSSMVDKSDLSTSAEALISDKQTQDEETSHVNCEENLGNTTNQPILTLNIGQTLDNLLAGNGAQLQLKRKASNDSTTQTVYVESEKTQTNNDNVMTIIFKFSNNDESQQQEAVSPSKKPREDKYEEMRRKNNVASRRCRQNRKSKQHEMEKVAEQLEEDNKKLKESVNKLEKEIQHTKAQFIKIFQIMACHGVHGVTCKIGPSILNADLAEIYIESQRLLDSGADYLHLDVMDGHFVPNLTFGHPVVKCLRSKMKSVFFDMHMMVSNPDKWIEPMADAGANMYTFHIEAANDVKGLIRKIKEAGMKVGIGLKPATNVHTVVPYISDVDMILIMTVEPGFGGQSFLSDMLPKVQYLRQHYKELDIEVDGGVGPATIDACAEAGANMIVSGSAIINSENPRQVISRLRTSVEEALQKAQLER